MVFLTFSLSEDVFHDLFWRLKRLNTVGNLAVVCADVMFNFQAPSIKDEALVSFAAKHDIKKMVTSDGTVKWYGCRLGLSYTKDKKCDWPNGIGAPPCDLWNLGEAVKFIMQACEEGGMHCEYAAGNVLGKIFCIYSSNKKYHEPLELEPLSKTRSNMNVWNRILGPVRMGKSYPR